MSKCFKKYNLIKSLKYELRVEKCNIYHYICVNNFREADKASLRIANIKKALNKIKEL